MQTRLTLSSLCLLLPCLLLVAGCGENASEAKTQALAQKIVTDFGDLKIKGEIRNSDYRYERKDEEFFHEAHGKNTGAITLIIAGRQTISPWDTDEAWEGEDGEYSRIYVRHDEDGFSIEEQQRKLGKGPEPVELASTFEAKVMEGNWEAYEAGQPITLALTDAGMARAEIHNLALMNAGLSPVFIGALKGEVMKQHGTDPAYLAALEYIDANASVASVGEITGLENTRYLVEKDTLIVRTENSIADITMSILLP